MAYSSIEEGFLLPKGLSNESKFNSLKSSKARCYSQYRLVSNKLRFYGLFQKESDFQMTRLFESGVL